MAYKRSGSGFGSASLTSSLGKPSPSNVFSGRFHRVVSEGVHYEKICLRRSEGVGPNQPWPSPFGANRIKGVTHRGRITVFLSMLA